MRTSVLRSATIVALVASLTGCGVIGGGDDTADADDESPLAELLGWNVNNSPAEQRALQLESEEAIASCMRAEGFEYIPVDYEAQFGGAGEIDDSLASDPAAYGEKYGYGIVFSYEQFEEPNLDGDQPGGGGPEFVDPNSDYVESLSDGERDEYFRVLYGDVTEFEAEFDEDGESTQGVPSPEEQGCTGKAQLEVFGDQIYGVDPAISDRIDDFFSGAEDDPLIREATQDWLECMGDELGALDDIESFQITGPDSMYQYVELRKALAQGKEIVPLDPATGEPVGGVDASEFGGYSSFENEDGTGWAYIGEDKPIPEAALEELRRFELDTWSVDWACQEQAQLRDRVRQVEQRLVDELRAEFPELGSSDAP